MTETTHRSHTLTWLVLVVAVILTLTVAVPLLQSVFDPVAQEAYLRDQARAAAQAEALDPLWLWLKRIAIGTLAVLCLAVALFAVNAAVHGARWFRNRATLVYPQHGLYPQQWERPNTGRPHVPLLGQPHQRLLPPANEPKAQIVAALTNGNLDRIPAGAMRPLLRNDPGEAALPEPEAMVKVELRPEDAVAPDIQQKPHRLVVGETGAGKTNTLRFIIGQYGRALPTAEFIIGSMVRKDWGHLLAATQPDEIAAAVHTVTQEIARRDDLMSRAGVTEFADMPGLAPLVFVLDEAEAVFDSFGNRRAAAEFKAELRNVIRVGRNFGVIGIFGTQLARRDMFDATLIDNMGEIYVHRCGKAVAMQFQVWATDVMDSLLTLPSGRAYCLKRASFTTFQPVGLPDVRVSRVYAPTLRLTADAEADGVGVNDLPDGATDATQVATSGPQWTAMAALRHAEGGVCLPERAFAAAVAPVALGAPTSITFANIHQTADLTEAHRRRVLATWQRLANPSLRQVEMALFSYTGGHAHDIVAAVIRDAYARRGQPAPWETRNKET